VPRGGSPFQPFIANFRAVPGGRTIWRKAILMKTGKAIPLLPLVVFLAIPAKVGARALDSARARSVYRAGAAVESPYITNRTHRIGNIGFTVSNWGFIGSETRDQRDPCTGRPAESCEFPIRSGIEYLFQGAMWVGAVRGRDTLVSVGADGWYIVNEFFPDPYPEGQIVERTTRQVLRSEPNSACPDVFQTADAVSEQDFVAVYYDTVTNSQFVSRDPIDGRPHIPLGIQIRQESYSWSFDYAQNFILMDLGIRNIGRETLRSLYMGLYMDHDVHHFNLGLEGYQDDITGFTHTVPSAVGDGYLDTVNIAWIADNDGDPALGRFNFASPTGVAGVRVVRAPTPDLAFSFNWWISNSTAIRDWGPNKRNTRVRYVSGNLGTPEGDLAKYNTMSNQEFDYPQVEAAIDHQTDGWLPPMASALAADLADGFDTRYLLSFGPFELPVDSMLPLTVALITGSEFHTEPRNFQTFFDPYAPEVYLQRLDLTNFARNAQWAGWVYDTPGYDTDSNGTRGNYRIIGRDTVYYSGDGVPDFQGPPPPPVPDVRFTTVEGHIVMRWNGERPETARDIFSNLADFEGYRIYMGRTGQLSDYALLAQRDNINFIRYRYKPDAFRWVVNDPPFTLDSLQSLYDDLTESVYGFPFHPDSFAVRDVEAALQEIVLDDVDPSRLDTNYYYFAPFDANRKVNDEAAYVSDSLGRDVLGIIRKRFPGALPADTVWENGVGYPMIYEYEFAISGLQLAEPVFMALTTFDFGNPAAGLASLESSPLVTAAEIWPLNSAAVVKATRPRPGVYPNPYRLADDYNALGWEDPARQGADPERSRKVTFTNIPDTCTIRIWSLDGDLVRELNHRADPIGSQATVAEWDLITRNTQAIKTGIYVYSIESRFGVDIGKLVIIK